MQGNKACALQLDQNEVLHRGPILCAHVGPFLLCRNMSNNAISGSLPNNWAFPDVFTQLQIVTLDHNQLGGSLPGAYSRGLKSLIVLNMDNNNFSGASSA